MGHNNGGGNPYHDPKTGRFTNALGVVSYSALTEQDLQISRNTEELSILNGEEPYLPYYYTDAAEAYEATMSFLNRDDSLIRQYNDFNDIQKTVDLMREVNNNASGGHLVPACYSSAGTLSAIFDHKGIADYSVWAGIGAANERIYSLQTTGRKPDQFNHVWIRRGDKIYDTFGNARLQDTPTAPRIYQEIKEFRFRR